ncbi:MAG: GNAT family N-acetyltransferase [Dehalococcoidia bacterium]|nr:GNAT family N-acetyltransferase [Dehalococcoidia bacterium]
MAAQIRLFRETDLNRVLDIAAAAWVPVFESYRDILGPALFDLVHPDWESAKRRQVAVECRDDSGIRVWVAEEDGEVAGFITAQMDRATQIGEIGNNAVEPGHQGRGLGTLMYEYVLDRMREAGMKCVTVGTGADASHASARRAYEKAGFSHALPSVQYYRTI